MKASCSHQWTIGFKGQVLKRKQHFYSIHSDTFTLYWHVLWYVLWYVLVACVEYILPASIQMNRYVFNIIKSILVCIVLVLCTYHDWILIQANTDLIHSTIHSSIGMYSVGIWYTWNNDSYKYSLSPNTCHYFNMCQHGRQYIHQYDPNTIKYRPIHSKHQYRPMHTLTLLFSVYANTGISTVKSGAPSHIASTASILFYQCFRGIWASQAVQWQVCCSRINHILLFIVRQFLCVSLSAYLAEWHFRT